MSERPAAPSEIVFDDGRPPGPPIPYLDSRADRISVLRLYLDLKDPDMPKRLQKARTLYPPRKEQESPFNDDDDAVAPRTVVQFDFVDRIRFLTALARIAARAGDKSNASQALAEAASLAIDCTAAEFITIAQTYWALGNSQAAWTFATQAISRADRPAQLFDAVNGFPSLLPIAGSDIARFFGSLAASARSLRSVYSKATPGWDVDWVDLTIYSGNIAKMSEDSEQLAKMRDVIKSARKDRSVASKLNNLGTFGVGWLR